MTESEIIQAIAKLKYQVSILGQAIDYDKHPVKALIMSNDWMPKDIEAAHDIFERWNDRLGKDEEMKSFEFEKEFADNLNIDYQGLKSIILAFYRNGQWTNVCEAYVDSLENSPPIEYDEIMGREH